MRKRAGAPCLPPAATGTADRCQHVTASGRQCGAILDAHGRHAQNCAIGGGTIRRHNRVVRALAAQMVEITGGDVALEVHVPAWDRPGGGDPTQAVLDIELTNHGMTGEATLYIDVAVTSPTSEDPRRAAAAARRDGYAADSMEHSKWRRYAPSVLPAVLETGGRLGASLRQWLRRAAAHRAGEAPTDTVATAYRAIAATLQREIAFQVLTAAGLRRLPRRAASAAQGNTWRGGAVGA